MKTVNYYLIICLCLCLSACNSNDKPEVENPKTEDPVEVEEPEIEDPVEVEEPEIEEPEIEEPEVDDTVEEPCPCLDFLDENNSNGEAEVEEPLIEEPCPDLDEVNPHFVYGDIPALSERLAYMGMERPADSYNYPAYPFMGGNGWNEATDSGKNIRKVCQVTPACLLRKMSTQAVIQAIWELPVLENFFFLLDPYLQRNIENQRNSYNAYEELYNRKDAGTALYKRLTLVDPLTTGLRSESAFLELLLSRSDFLSQLNESEKRKTVEVTLANDYKRYGEWVAGGYATPSRPTAWILIGNAMSAACYCPFIEAMNENEDLKCFIEGWMRNPISGEIVAYLYTEYFYGNIPDIIIDHAKNFIND